MSSAWIKTGARRARAGASIPSDLAHQIGHPRRLSSNVRATFHKATVRVRCMTGQVCQVGATVPSDAHSDRPCVPLHSSSLLDAVRDTTLSVAPRHNLRIRMAEMNLCFNVRGIWGSGLASRRRSRLPAATGVNVGRGPSVPPDLLPHQKDPKADVERPAVRATCELQRYHT